MSSATSRYLSEVPASCRRMSSRSSRDTTPSPSMSYTSNRKRTRSARLARALKAARMRTNSCAGARVLGCRKELDRIACSRQDVWSCAPGECP